VAENRREELERIRLDEIRHIELEKKGREIREM
jgi:hypothetical protein